MNTYIVYYRAFNESKVFVSDESIVVSAYSKNEACKIASMKIEGGHSIKFASQIKGPVPVY